MKFTSNVQPACLWRTFDTSPLGTKAISTGWGVIETGINPFQIMFIIYDECGCTRTHINDRSVGTN